MMMMGLVCFDLTAVHLYCERGRCCIHLYVGIAYFCFFNFQIFVGMFHVRLTHVFLTTFIGLISVNLYVFRFSFSSLHGFRIKYSSQSLLLVDKRVFIEVPDSLKLLF